MRTLLIVLLFCSISCISRSQAVSVKKDIVYKDDQPYCKLVKTSNVVPRFSIRNLNDEELIVAKFSNDDQRYTITFLESGLQCYMSGTMGFGKILAKDLVASNVIKDNKVNPVGERQFLLEHNGSGPSPGLVDAPATVSSDVDNRYNVVERDHTKPVMIFGNEISQDNTTIGSYSVQNTTVNGKLIKVFAFVLPNGQKVAEGTLDGINARNCRLVILKNNQAVTVGVKSVDDMTQAKEIAGYLVGRYLL